MRGQRPLGEQRGQRAGEEEFGDDPQAAVLREDVEDLLQPGVTPSR
ncbi:hypothetical protein [Streptomyces nigrescens]